MTEVLANAIYIHPRNLFLFPFARDNVSISLQIALNGLKQRKLIKVPSNLESQFKLYEATSKLRMEMRPYLTKGEDVLSGSTGIK